MANKIPKKVASSLKKFLDYAWDDEEGSFEEWKLDGQKPEQHIFTHMKRVQRWLEKCERGVSR